MSEAQPNNPLHGITNEMLLKILVEKVGWEKLSDATGIKVFAINPTHSSALKFIRTTPWAKKKLEDYYLYLVRTKKI